MQNLLELNQPALAQFFAQLGEKPASVKMRAKQTLKWLHQSQVTDFSAMTDIAKATRELLAANAEIRDLNVIRDSTASDGTRKWLFDVGTSAVDAVFIPEDDRGTLCISSQAGCALDCAFWDLECKRSGKSIWSLISRSHGPCSCSISRIYSHQFSSAMACWMHPIPRRSWCAPLG